MKKTVLLLAGLAISSLTIAGGNSEKKKSLFKANDEGILSNGFYFNIGVGMPVEKYKTVKFKDGEKQDVKNPKDHKLGTQINLEIGNQWYFVTKEKMAFGLRVTWLQLGYSSITDQDDSKIKGFFADAKILNIAPQFTYSPTEKLGIDVYFSGGLAGYGGAYKVPGKPDAGMGGPGYVLAPGLRLRYDKFALGFDYSMANYSGNETPVGFPDDIQVTKSVKSPRFYLGMQF